MKKRMMVSWLLILGLFLTACGAQSQSKSATSQAPVKITFWHAMNGSYQKALNGIIDDFNQSHPQYQVQGINQASYTGLQQKIMAAAKAKTLPTMAQTTDTSVLDYQQQQLIVSLDPYLKGSNGLSKNDLQDIYPAFLSSTQYHGHYYAMPFSKSTRIMYVNQDILDQYHLKMPTSWEAIQKISGTLKAAGLYTIGFDKSFDMDYQTLAYQNGVQTVTKTGQVNFDSAKSLEATHVITDMIQAGTAKTAGEDNYFTNRFIQGQSLLYIGSSAGITQMQQQAPKTLHWQTTQVPSYHGKQATLVAGNDVVLMKGSSKAQQKGAWLFMKYLTSAKVTAKWAATTNYAPLRRSAVQTTSYQNYLKKNPEAQATVDSLPTAFAAVAFKGASTYQLKMWAATDNILTKGQTPEQALGTLQQQIEKTVQAK